MNKKEQELIREINKLLDTNKDGKKFSVLDITLLLIYSNILTEEHFETLGRDTINDIIKTQLDKHNSLKESEEETSEEEDVEMEVVDIDIDKYIPKIYSVLLGILLTTEEANRNGENFNTFNQNQYGFEIYCEEEGLDISKEQVIKEAISYCRSGIPYTYGIVSEFYQEDTFLTSSEFTDAINHIEKGDFYDYYSVGTVLDMFENKNIIYSVYKDANGNLIEDFLDKPIPGLGDNQQQ